MVHYLAPAIDNHHFSAVAGHVILVTFQHFYRVEVVVLTVGVGGDEIGQQNFDLFRIVGQGDQHRVKIRLLKSLREQRIALCLMGDGHLADAPTQGAGGGFGEASGGRDEGGGEILGVERDA